ncbi:hypothetical protein [Burkholderia sp. AW49-1]
MSTMNDEPYDLHDQDEDDDDLTGSLHDDDDEYDQDEGEDHAIDSDIALDGFTDRAMRHGRRAATWLLVGVLAELGVYFGGCFVAKTVPAKGLPSYLVILLLSFVTGAIMLVILVAAHKRWDRHRTKMANVLEDAMVWRSDVQQKEQDEADAVAQHYYDRADEDKREALAEELTWNVGPAPVFIDADGCRHPTPDQVALEEHARREAGGLFDSLDGPDEQHDDDTESDNVPVAPAVRAWMQRWADLKPVKRPEPVFKRSLQRHSDAEGRRLERELCSAINKHWDGAFHRLITEGANPNGHDDSGQPLRKAVLRGRLEHISWLLTLGADPNAQPFGRSILQAVMTQVEHFADEEERGDGDACEWPETLELLGRWGANPFIKNRYYDRDDETEGPTPWPQILKRPILYEAFMKGRNAWLQADQDAMRLLRDGRESVALAEVADETRAMLDTFRSPGRA